MHMCVGFPLDCALVPWHCKSTQPHAHTRTHTRPDGISDKIEIFVEHLLHSVNICHALAFLYIWIRIKILHPQFSFYHAMCVQALMPTHEMHTVLQFVTVRAYVLLQAEISTYLISKHVKYISTIYLVCISRIEYFGLFTLLCPKCVFFPLSVMSTSHFGHYK